jgi:hypothetical protein
MKKINSVTKTGGFADCSMNLIWHEKVKEELLCNQTKRMMMIRRQTGRRGRTSRRRRGENKQTTKDVYCKRGKLNMKYHMVQFPLSPQFLLCY